MLVDRSAYGVQDLYPSTQKDSYNSIRQERVSPPFREVTIWAS